MYNIEDLLFEAQESLDRIWFVQTADVVERTNATISIRLHIQPELFIQVFMGQLSNSLYFALIEGNRRIFGIDRESGEWHMHPYENPHEHKPLEEGLEPKPLLRFLSRVELLLLEHDLL